VVLAAGATLSTTTKDEGVDGAVKKQTKSVRRQTSFHNQVAGHTKKKIFSGCSYWEVV